MQSPRLFLALLLPCGLAWAGAAGDAPGAAARPCLLRPQSPPFLPTSGEVRLVADLDRDGYDELVIDRDATAGQRRRTIEIRNHDGTAVGAWVDFTCDRGPTGHRALDVNDDGFPEIVFSYVLRDTLFLAVLDRQAHQVARVAVAERGPGPPPSPPRDPTWAPGLVPQEVVDCDGDGFLDIVACGSAGYWLQPRGVWALSWARREVIWHHATGTVTREAVVARMPGHLPRIIVSSYAAGNGGSFNDTDDSHSYVIVLSLSGELVRRHAMGARDFVGTHVTVLNGAGASPQVVSATACGDLADPKPAVIALWHGAGDSIVSWVEAGLTDTDVQAADLDGDGREELLLGTRVGELAVYRADLTLMARVPFGEGRSTVEAVGDLTGDPLPEVVVGGELGCAVIDPLRKKVLATLEGFDRAFVVRRGAAGPVLAARGVAGWQQFTVERNPAWAPWGTVRTTIPGLTVAGAVSLVLGAALVLVRRRAPVLPACAEHGMAFVDRRGRARATNWALSRLLGTEGAPSCGQPLDCVLERSGLEPVPTLAELSGHGGQWVSVSYRHAADRRVLLRAVPVAGGALVEVQGVPDGQASQARLAWPTMAPRVAHDLKSPLSTLVLATERVLRAQSEASSAPRPELVQAVLHQVDRIDLLTRSFLKLADLEQLNPTPVSLDEFIAACLRELEARIPPGVTVDRRIEPALPQVHVDREQVQSALENLFENALAALGKGGTILVSAYRVSSVPGRSTPSGAVAIEVADTGEGIASADIPRLFDVGFTRRQGGTGLGLAIVRQVMNQHHGHIEVHSEVGIGTTVILYLPVGPRPQEHRSASISG